MRYLKRYDEGGEIQDGWPILTKKERLLKRAEKAHEKAYKRGDEIVGWRTVAEPRTLSTMELPMSAREMELREKAFEAGQPEDPKVKILKRPIDRTFLSPEMQAFLRDLFTSKKRNKCRGGKCPSVAYD